jgi:hypothetical protein
VSWLCNRVAETQIMIFIGAQPNSSPHMGNICNIATAFTLGQQLQAAGKVVCVCFDAVDTAPSFTGSRSLAQTTLASTKNSSSGEHLRPPVRVSKDSLSLSTVRRFSTGPARSSPRACTWSRLHTHICEAQTLNTC